MYKKVTIVCTGNTCRSAMGKVLFDEIIKKTELEIKSDSCGLSTHIGMKANKNAIKVCEENGIEEIKEHISKPIDEDIIKSTDLFVVMTLEHSKALIDMGIAKEKIYILNVEDPFAGNLQRYRECLEEISDGLIILIELIKRQG